MQLDQILDARRLVIRSPEVTAHLHALVLAEPGIAAATGIEPDPQAWGQSALHFAARGRGGEPLLLKVNVPRDQLWWTLRLAERKPHMIPRVYAAGELLGGLPLGWVLWERAPGGLHPGWGGREFDMLLEAGVKFQVAARALADEAAAAGALSELRPSDVAAQLEAGLRRGAPGPAERVLARLTEDWEFVAGACEAEVCHGDLHMANAVTRVGPPGGEALLIDHHPTLQPWAYEPAKPEVLNADPARAGCRGLVARQADIRRRMGLGAPDGAELARAQATALGWWAIQLWAHIGPDPDPSWRAPSVWRAEIEAFVEAAARA